jgi:hypothetical protein
LTPLAIRHAAAVARSQKMKKKAGSRKIEEGRRRSADFDRCQKTFCSFLI